MNLVPDLMLEQVVPSPTEPLLFRRGNDGVGEMALTYRLHGLPRRLGSLSSEGAAKPECEKLARGESPSESNHEFGRELVCFSELLLEVNNLRGCHSCDRGKTGAN
jgi:hypothetical protein